MQQRGFQPSLHVSLTQLLGHRPTLGCQLLCQCSLELCCDVCLVKEVALLSCEASCGHAGDTQQPAPAAKAARTGPPVQHQPVNGRQHSPLQLQTDSPTVLSWLVSTATSLANSAWWPSLLWPAACYGSAAGRKPCGCLCALDPMKLASQARACDSACAVVLQAVSCSDHAGLLASVAKVIADHGFNIQVPARLLGLLSVCYCHAMIDLRVAAADRSSLYPAVLFWYRWRPPQSV